MSSACVLKDLVQRSNSEKDQAPGIPSAFLVSLPLHLMHLLAHSLILYVKFGGRNTNLLHMHWLIRTLFFECFYFASSDFVCANHDRIVVDFMDWLDWNCE